VAKISVATPWAQVLELAEDALNARVERAEQEPQDKPFRFIVRVGILIRVRPPPWNPGDPSVGGPPIDAI
jgi:hypothetical protein